MTGTRPGASSICAKAESSCSAWRAIEYHISDGREVKVEFIERAGGVLVKETFDAETENTPELQRTGWQAILDNFGRHVEAKG